MVIDDHAGTRIGFLSSFFPYNSFYIPLFVFISGYFYRKMPIADNIRHKAKRLLLPYLIWAAVGDLIAFVLLKAVILFWYKLLQLPATKIGALPAVDFLAENTFTIICSHLLFLNIPNFYANARCLAGDPTFSDFPAADFYLSAWTRYNADARLVGFFLGIIGSCLVILLLNTFKKNFTH